MISSFLWRPSKHFLVIFEYCWTDFTIYQYKDGVSLYMSFTSNQFFKRAVSYAFFLLLNDVLWLWYRFLRFPSAVHRYTLSGLTVAEAIHLYIISLAWQLPCSGQKFFFYNYIGFLVLLFCYLLLIVSFNKNE